MDKESFLQELAILLERLEVSHERWPVGCLLQLEEPTEQFCHYEWDGEKLAPEPWSRWHSKTCAHLEKGSGRKVQLQAAADNRLTIYFQNGGSFSPRVGTPFYASEEGVTVQGLNGPEIYTWERIREVHIPQPQEQKGP